MKNGFRAYRNGVHACERSHDGCAAKNQHSADNDVGQEAEEEEHKMGHIPPAGMDNLQHCVC